jgi:energy-coupling factor transporter ATP-binding protein EcfA2/DNA repair exonuclease SbcCD nuclease subunit
VKILFLSDTQADSSNIDLCYKLQERLLSLCKKYDVKAVVHCGDGKQQYSPVDVEVCNFFVGFIQEFKHNGIEFYFNMGNHDRIGLYRDDQHWLDILEAAGAYVYDRPEMAGMFGACLFFLPFRTSSADLVHDAIDLAAKTLKNTCKTKILIFHADLKGAHYSVVNEGRGEIKPSDLHPEKYTYCIGGHLHWQQKIGKNIWYVGSPFAMDWGEANQFKGFLLLDTDTKKLTRIPSGFPGWYDLSLPGFEAPKSWEGATIRVHSEDTPENRAKLGAYSGARLVFQPMAKTAPDVIEGISSDIPDADKVAEYIDRTIPETIKKHQGKVTEYVQGTLAKCTGAVESGRGLTFDGVRAKNVLSYESISLDFQPGTIVITGLNGAGKSNLMSLTPVALFNCTFKGQKHNSWRHRWAEDGAESWVTLFFTDWKNRKLSLYRGRKPKGLLLKEHAKSGDDILEGNRPELRQKQIEDLIGFSFETFANSLYIDQRRENVMLEGRDFERKNFLARMFNLERFAKALEYVKSKRSELEMEQSGLDADIRECKHKAELLLASINALQSNLLVEDVDDIKGTIQSEEERAKDMILERRELEKKQDAIDSGSRITSEAIRTLSGERGDINGVIQRLAGLEGSAACPVCLSPISAKHTKTHLDAYGVRLTAVEAKIAAARKKEESTQSERLGIRKKIKDLSDEISRIHLHVSLLKERLESMRKRAEQDAGREQSRANFQRDLETTEAKQADLAKKLKTAEWHLQLVGYAIQAFSRDGIPAYLLANLVPRLNKAASLYAEKFFDSMIQVRFIISLDGDADVEVTNVNGGELISDQSAGEMRMASIVTSFALRDCAPKTNLLILDEPGDGLDPQKTRMFARGLRTLSKDVCTICVSHNPVFLGEMASERLVTVVKEGKISAIKNADASRSGKDTE